MSKIVSRVRHFDIVARLGHNGFEPVRGARDASSRAPSKHSDAKAAVSKVVAQIQALGRRVDAAGSKFGKTSDSLDRAADAARHVADARRLSGFRTRARPRVSAEHEAAG